MSSFTTCIWSLRSCASWRTDSTSRSTLKKSCDQCGHGNPLFTHFGKPCTICALVSSTAEFTSCSSNQLNRHYMDRARENKKHNLSVGVHSVSVLKIHISRCEPEWTAAASLRGWKRKPVKGGTHEIVRILADIDIRTSRGVVGSLWARSAPFTHSLTSKSGSENLVRSIMSLPCDITVRYLVNRTFYYYAWMKIQNKNESVGARQWYVAGN